MDATSRPLRVVREGAVSLERLREVVPGLLDIDGNAAESDTAAAAAAEAAAEAEPAGEEPVGGEPQGDKAPHAE